MPIKLLQFKSKSEVVAAQQTMHDNALHFCDSPLVARTSTVARFGWPVAFADIYGAFMSIRPVLTAFALVLSGAFVLSGCGPSTAQPGPTGGPPVSVAAAITRDVAPSEEYSARLEAVEVVDIRSRIAGEIRSVEFKPGARVAKGQVLFRIDARSFEAELARARADLAQRQSQADLANSERVRASTLLADKVISQQEADERINASKQSLSQVNAAQAAIKSIALNIDYATVRSPIAGRVGKADITVGNLVSSQNVLTTVVASDKVFASFEVDEAALLRSRKAAGADGLLAVGGNVTLALNGQTQFGYKGTIDFIDTRLDTKAGTLRARAVFPNADGSLIPGMYARLQLGGSAKTSAVLISDKAVGTDQGRKFVYTVGADGKAAYRPVQLGGMADGLRVVASGLKAGEVIVVSGLQRVRPGAPLTPQTIKMEDADAPPQQPDKAAAPASAPSAPASAAQAEGKK
jgi:membrane fusion protein, multidrug efflux system